MASSAAPRLPLERLVRLALQVGPMRQECPVTLVRREYPVLQSAPQGSPPQCPLSVVAVLAAEVRVATALSAQ